MVKALNGYMEKLLRVNLTEGSFKDFKLTKDLKDNYIGGVGIGARLLYDELAPDVDPLGPDNILLFLPGPLTGFFPGGRICVSGKSPQSNGVIGSTVGGEFGVELRCAGYDGIIVTGQAEKPVYLFIKDSDVEIRDASNILPLCPRMLLKK